MEALRRQTTKKTDHVNLQLGKTFAVVRNA